MGRATEVPLAAVDRIAKLIPFNADLSDALAQSAEFKAMYDEDPDSISSSIPPASWRAWPATLQPTPPALLSPRSRWPTCAALQSTQG